MDASVCADRPNLIGSRNVPEVPLHTPASLKLSGPSLIWLQTFSLNFKMYNRKSFSSERHWEGWAKVWEARSSIAASR
jgi:hypothetical protein